MKRRDFLKSAGCFLAAGSAGFASESKKPNIVFILADDLGYGDVGFNGQTKIKTPNIDSIAEEGAVFTNHYSGSTVCGPSRCCLMTGRHTGHASVRGNPRWTADGKPVDIPKSEPTVADELKRAGYKTCAIGKWGLAENLGDAMPTKKGFDEFYGFMRHGPAHHYYPEKIWRNEHQVSLPNKPKEKEGLYVHDLFTQEAFKYISRQDKNNPFFLYLAYTIPHYELTVPEDSKEPYQKLGWKKRPMKQGHYYHDKEGNTTYAGMVSRMDRDIGSLMELLKKRGLYKNTLVIFTSDNGHHYDKGFFDSNGVFRGKKRDLYEGGIHIPFAARWPEMIRPGTKSSHISAFWDFLPTACDIAGIEPKAKTDGISYFQALKGNTRGQIPHKCLYWEFNEWQGPVQAVRKGKWKAVRYKGKPLELYDLTKDTGENNDISADYPDQAKQMAKLMESSRTEDSNFPFKNLRK
ncbi:Arylsulfatase precursor [Sedimentisphaera cyanobacteriorum]|uniref:Arylsulfatase n=1 Tax=Sedimentisphaera cyanobacteriorum TaxID=1940790 RepID=A0A1Q2HSS0_9BACT|nr:arylsulfatase [Sedimentisphaera cyanobacteriorum]AQQ10285.1 Arylsulfatase precursor [Sedimentisphaera cyanobacteriorum]